MYRKHQIFSGKSGFESKLEQYFQHVSAQDQIWVTLSGIQSQPISQYCVLLHVSVKVSSQMFDRVSIRWREYEEKYLLSLLKSCISSSLITTAIWSYYKNLHPWRRKRKPYFNQFHFKSRICQTQFYAWKSMYNLKIIQIYFEYWKARAQAYIKMHPVKTSAFGG